MQITWEVWFALIHTADDFEAVCFLMSGIQRYNDASCLGERSMSPKALVTYIEENYDISAALYGHMMIAVASIAE